MQTITKGQLTKIHVLLNQCKMMDSKADLVSGASAGRTESSRELSQAEAKALIKYLVQFDELEPMRRKVFALAYTAGIIYGDTPEDKKMNAAKLNKFIREKGTIKNDLNRLNRAELIKTVNQFEMISKHSRQADNNKAAALATNDLLKELNLSAPIPAQKQTRKTSNQL